jgi:hypothetical protein
MKAQFNKVKKLARQIQQESWKLDRMIDEKYGFSYSETDDDKMIDTLDYGTDDISFEEFDLRMSQYKKGFDKNGQFTAIP